MSTADSTFILIRCKRHGQPRKFSFLNDPDLQERFWSKVDKKGPNDCWLWKAYINELGYGDFGYNRRIVAAHRMAMMLHTQRYFETHECILHDCPKGDNPACCNPRHLWIGTKKDNTRDMVKKKRSRGRLSKGVTTLTDKEVSEMIRLRKKGWKLMRLSKKFKVHLVTVRNRCKSDKS